MTFTEFKEKKNVTGTIGDQAASLLGPLMTLLYIFCFYFIALKAVCLFDD